MADDTIIEDPGSPESLSIDINDEMAKSFVDYAMSVIVSRALPDVRDGLKPVQRRIIYAMDDLGIGPGSAHRKSATVVGEVIGKYHPHSNDAIYDALVRMGQDFSLRYPLVHPQGNFGTTDDPPAAMRYCVVGETRIRTVAGTVRIDEIAEAKPNSDVDIQVKVLDRRGDPVMATKLFHSGLHSTLRLSTREGYSITATANHPLLVLTEVAGVPVFQWLLLEELQPGDRVAIARHVPSTVGLVSDRVAAACLAAGAFVGRRSAAVGRIALATSEAVAERVVSEALTILAEGTRGLTGRGLGSGDSDVFAVGELREIIGERGADAAVPDFVWRAGPAGKRVFLQACFEVGGTVARSATGGVEVGYSSPSAALVADLQRLLLEFGVVSRRVGADREYSLIVSGRRDVERFASNLGFLATKQEELASALGAWPACEEAATPEHIPFVADYVRAAAGGPRRLGRHDPGRSEHWEQSGDEMLGYIGDPEARSVVEQIVAEGYFYATVDSIEDAGVQAVYSIRVDSDDHSFLADGFVNHNTECRMESITTALLDGIDENTVDFDDNYNGEEQEPIVLPSRFPNLLVNGSQGIAVGMATNIPPHNLGEVIDACLFGLENPDANPEDYLSIIKGPDFPTGGYIVGTKGIKEALVSGRGSIKLRAVTDVEEVRKGRTAIVVTELPYQVSQDRLLGRIAELVNDKKISGIADLRNESDSRTGMRLVIELKRDAAPQVVLNQLLKMTQLQDTFGVNTVALVDGVPRTLNIAELVGYYLDHQMEVIERRTQFRLDKATARAHIVEGLIIAVDNIDEVVALIRASADTPAARQALIERFELSEIQATEILNMPLRRLTSLETSRLREEYAELVALIEELEGILADPAKRRALIADELEEIRQKHSDGRRARIIPDEGDLSLEDLIADDELVVTVSANGYVKSVTANTYRAQGRGGRGVKGAEMREDDVLTHVLHTTAHAYLLFFTNTGKVHRIKAHEIPRQQRTSKGVLAQAVLPLEPEERIRAIVDTRDYETSKYLVMVTKRGQVKKTAFMEYDSRNATLIAINLADDDEVVAVRTTSGHNEMLVFTRNGQGIRFSEDDLRPMGRATQGVRGIKLKESDEVVAAAANVDGDEVLLLTSGGYGKRTKMDQFPLQRRGGMGVKAIKLTRVRGKLVGAQAGSGDGQVFVTSSDGIVIRMDVKGISRQKRDASGVKVMNLAAGTELTAFTRVPPEEEA